MGARATGEVVTNTLLPAKKVQKIYANEANCKYDDWKSSQRLSPISGSSTRTLNELEKQLSTMRQMQIHRYFLVCTDCFPTSIIYGIFSTSLFVLIFSKKYRYEAQGTPLEII